MKNLRIKFTQSDFKDLVGEGYFYLDKSLFIEEMWEEANHVFICPRPRRFGKTTNLSMLRYFFENRDTEENGKLFENLKIASKPTIMAQQGKYPVVFLTFKEGKQDSFEDILDHLKGLLSDEFQRHDSILKEKILHKQEEVFFHEILYKKANLTDTQRALFKLTEFLHRLYGKKVILLIDEYDTPIHSAYQNNFFKKMANFMRGFLGSCLKDNTHLEKAVVTGILRVAKESIFSDINNPKICNLFETVFCEQFGFTEEEVKNLLKEGGLENYAEDVRHHYNGYLIGGKVIYNPWSILHWASNSNHEFLPYWLGTSSNELVRDLILENPVLIEEDVEALLRGKSISCEVLENLSLRDIQGNRDVIWSLFLFSGYLKPVDSTVLTSSSRRANLLIPNEEVRVFFKESVLEWMKKKVGIPSLNLQKMLQSLTEGNLEKFGPLFQEWLILFLSYHDPSGPASRGENPIDDDPPERVYHAFFLGLMASLESDYIVESNAESGLGRFDLMLIPKKTDEIGLVIELKKRDKPGSQKIEVEFDQAMLQIQEKDYPAKLRKHSITKILSMAMLFHGKQVWIKSHPLSDFGHSPQTYESPYSPPPPEEKFDFAQEFDLLLTRFEKFQKLVLVLDPSLEKKLDKIDDKLNAITPAIKDKSQVPPDAWNRLRQLLKSPEIQNQPKIKNERKALKSSYEKIARWLGLPV